MVRGVAAAAGGAAAARAWFSRSNIISTFLKIEIQKEGKRKRQIEAEEERTYLGSAGAERDDDERRRRRTS